MNLAQQAIAASGILPFLFDDLESGNADPTDLRFPGQIYDIEYGLNYNSHRDYDPTLGRYIQPDPTGFRGGYNLYAYAGQNPTQWIDPSGLWAFGISLEWANIDSFAFFSHDPSTGGVGGLNFECTSTDGCHVYKYQTPKECTAGTNPAGLDTGFNVSLNGAAGEGGWTGNFDNLMGSYGLFSGSYFVSAPGEGNYQGASFGIGAGLPGVGVARTNYQFANPPPYVYPQPPQPTLAPPSPGFDWGAIGH